MRELSLNVMDVVQNSVTAGATLIEIMVAETPAENTMVLTIGDNGKGMSPEQLEQVQNPFYTTRTTRRVGLGVPFFKMAAEMTGGDFSIRSTLGEGTQVTARFHTDHIDMVPLGAMSETVLLLITANPDLDFVYRHTAGERAFTLDTRELREILGEDVSLAMPDVTLWIKEYLAEQEAALKEGP